MASRRKVTKIDVTALSYVAELPASTKRAASQPLDRECPTLQRPTDRTSFIKGKSYQQNSGRRVSISSRPDDEQECMGSAPKRLKAFYFPHQSIHYVGSQEVLIFRSEESLGLIRQLNLQDLFVLESRNLTET